MVLKRRLLLAGLAIAVGARLAWPHQADRALHVLVDNGGVWWDDVAPDSPRLSPAIRLALAGQPDAEPGDVAWLAVAPGFETADMAVTAKNQVVDHILLARIDPQRFRFVLRSAPAGDRNLDDWMAQLGAALVVNGAYYGFTGAPDTPVLSDGVALGPKEYDAHAGAFVAGPGFTGIRDLAAADWQTAFKGAQNAAVSFPMLVAEGQNRVPRRSRWLANRSFVGQDAAGRILIGTTTDAFFSLDRLAEFLRRAPLSLRYALNLDGGPVACQGIALGDYRRKTYGRWELQAEGDRVKLLTWSYGKAAMPVVLAVLPKTEGPDTLSAAFPARLGQDQ